MRTALEMRQPLPDHSAKVDSASPAFQRPKVHGKLLILGEEKFFVKGVTYGAFPPNSRGHQLAEQADVERDFHLMRQAGINAILTCTVPDIALLGQAQAHGLRVIVNIPWQAHVCFLEERRIQSEVRRQVGDAIRSLRQHPAILMHWVAKELPQSPIEIGPVAARVPRS